MDRLTLYQQLYDVFKNRYTEFNGSKIQDMTNSFWNSVKNNSNCPQLVKEKIVELNTQINRRSITHFFKKVQTSEPKISIDTSQTDVEPIKLPSPQNPTKSELSTESCLKVFTSEQPAPKQVALKNQLSNCCIELSRLKNIKHIELATDDTFTQIMKLEREKSNITKTLKRLHNNALHNRESRKRKKEKIDKLQAQNPEINLVKTKLGPWPKNQLNTTYKKS